MTVVCSPGSSMRSCRLVRACLLLSVLWIEFGSAHEAATKLELLLDRGAAKVLLQPLASDIAFASIRQISHPPLPEYPGLAAPWIRTSKGAQPGPSTSIMSLTSSLVQNSAMLYLTLGPAFALMSLTTTPSMVPMALLLTTLRAQVMICVPRGRPGLLRIGLQVILVSAASMVAHMEPSIHALSTPSTSIVVLGCLSLITSVVAFLAILSAYLGERILSSPWSKVTLFPTLWTTVWGAVARVSPVGQLISWSPVDSITRYEWIRPVVGQYGIDWVTAALAVVLTEIFGALLMTSTESSDAEDPPLISVSDDETRNGTANGISKHHEAHISRTYRTLCLAGILFALVIPPAFLPETPLPVDSHESTPLSVACVLPYHPSGQHSTLQDYIQETQHLQSTADIILWPEIAVRFDSPEEKDAALEAVRQVLPHRKLLGVAFEEYLPPRKGSREKEGTRRNGLVLLTNETGIVFEYHKRMLVPVAESSLMTPSTEPPSIYDFHLAPPKPYTPGQWAPAPNHTRSIPVTVSICLDFSSSSSFSHLASRPALILAPARTWHIGIGHAMWEQARARADETGSTVLWCDGGADGVSGVVGGGIREYTQRGQGSFVRKIGVQWPFDERRTLYSYGADYAALWVIWAVFFVGLAVDETAIQTVHGDSGSFAAWLRLRGFVFRMRAALGRLRLRRRMEEERPLLE